jgi:hypothetical protein
MNPVPDQSVGVEFVQSEPLVNPLASQSCCINVN